MVQCLFYGYFSLSAAEDGFPLSIMDIISFGKLKTLMKSV